MTDYIMPGIPPPMPPMPPISGIAGAEDLSSGLSVIIASVVVNNAATETASIKAVLTTLVGSTIPALTKSQNLPVCASKPCELSLLSKILPAMTAPSKPEF